MSKVPFIFGDTSDTNNNNKDTNNASERIKIIEHKQYTSPRFTRDQCNPSPFKQFQEWFSEAQSPPSNSGLEPVREPEAVCVSTVGAQGIPSSRMVLFRGMDERGFVWFTNYTSRKSKEIEENPKCSLVWYWKEQARQVRVIGNVVKVEREESEEYFNTRPRGSQIGAWASEQSSIIGEETMEERVKALEEKFEGMEVECPPHWGGWRVVPFEIEFWAGHSSRLHDRFRYILKDDGTWEINRLAP